MTFAAFFLNPDGTIYGRYGTRSSQKDAQRDVSIAGFKKALERALPLHREYPANRALLANKVGPRPRFARPELYPGLRKFKPTIDYKGKVSSTCIHCHNIGDEERKLLRSEKRPLPARDLYPWPTPTVVGLTLDPDECATVLSVAPSSAASRAGFLAGDEIETLSGQPLLSIADVQWVLHRSGDGGTLRARVRRGGASRELKMRLEKGWRSRSDISWRTTSWDLRRMVTGGMLLEGLTAEQRREHGLPADRLGLLAKHVGQYGDHGRAKRAGFKKGDIIVEWDGSSAPMRETDILARGMQMRRPGDRVRVTVLRGGKRKELSFGIK